MKNKKQLISLVQKDNKNTIKLYSLLLFFCFLTFTSANAQTGKVSINLKNASVKELFNAIESQTPYRFSYRSVEVENKKGVTISVKNAKLKDLLIQELPKHHLSHIVQGNKIIVTPATDNQSSDKSNKVTGKVVDTNGEPIVGATIKEQGTTNGTITDMDGNFSFMVSPNTMIEISYIGYQEQRIKTVFGKSMFITLKEDTELLDVGTGSGILSIIGLKLGAHHAMATDIDPNAIRATNENFAINEVSEQAEVQQVNILDKEEADSFYEKNNGKKYDVIVANILADVIIPLSGIVAPLLKDDGVFITSGIINTMEEAVKEAMLANHFEILEINHMKDWVSITAKKA